MKVTTTGGRSTGKTMAQLKQDNDALKEQLSFLAGRVATLNEFCQVNNIGEWGDSVVSAVIKHCEGLAAQNAEQAKLLKVWQTWLGASRSRCDESGALLWDKIEAVTKSAPVEFLRQIQADAVVNAASRCKFTAEILSDEHINRFDVCLWEDLIQHAGLIGSKVSS